MVLMLLGLMTPAVTAVITVLTSGSRELKSDLKRKLVGFYRIKPFSILKAVIGFAVIVAVSILLSLLVGTAFRSVCIHGGFLFFHRRDFCTAYHSAGIRH